MSDSKTKIQPYKQSQANSNTILIDELGIGSNEKTMFKKTYCYDLSDIAHFERSAFYYPFELTYTLRSNGAKYSVREDHAHELFKAITDYHDGKLNPANILLQAFAENFKSS